MSILAVIVYVNIVIVIYPAATSEKQAMVILTDDTSIGSNLEGRALQVQPEKAIF